MGQQGNGVKANTVVHKQPQFYLSLPLHLL